MQSSRFAVAVHIMTLAQIACGEHAGELVTSEQMAGSVNTNPVVIRRIMGSLREAGLVVSQPGPGGGWRLARSPEGITLLDIYRAVEREPRLAFPARPPSDHCPIGSNMQRVLERHFHDAELAMGATLGQVTMADIFTEVLDGRSLSEIEPPARRMPAAAR